MEASPCRVSQNWHTFLASPPKMPSWSCLKWTLSPSVTTTAAASSPNQTNNPGNSLRGSVDKYWEALKQKSLTFGEKSIPVGTWYFTSAHSCDTILNINYLTRTRNIASLPWKIVTTSFQEFILSSGVFRRETESGFFPWCKVDSPRKRVAAGLCGWRHGNSFPMPQSAQSHRQMRSIPRCSKAVFYVFVFLIPFAIQQHCIIIASVIFHWAISD